MKIRTHGSYSMIARRSFCLIPFLRISVILCIVFFQTLGFASAQPELAELSKNVLDQIESLLTEKGQRTPAQKKISSHLLHAKNIRMGRPVAPGVQRLFSGVKVHSGDTTDIFIRADVSPSVIGQIRAMGGTNLKSFPKHRAIHARVPLSQLESLALLPQVQFIRQGDHAITNSHSIPNVSEGDHAHRSDLVRSTFGINGAGVTVGVMSDGVDDLAHLQGVGDLPTNVTVLSGQAGSGSEGTAMLEIVHDMAPGADLLFATAFSTQQQFANNILALRDAGADIIVDDVFYFAETPFIDGTVAQAVNDVTASGVLFFSSAGNSGNINDNRAGVWEGDFKAMDIPGALSHSSFNLGDKAHDFGGGTATNKITDDPPNWVILWWSDLPGSSNNDYDLFLIDSSGGNVLAASTSSQTGTQDPLEFIDSRGIANHLNARLMVVRNNGAQDRFLHLNTHRGELDIATNGQTLGHAAAADAFGVAAVDVDKAGGGVFTGGASNPVETFSSDGPRRMFYHANGTEVTPGNLSATGGLVRQKPDIAAADGVRTSTPGFNPFFGTSAAAPHAAAIAALVKSADLSLTPGEIRTVLESTALDIEAPGIDQDSGYGLLDAFAAVQSVNPIVQRELTVILAGNGSGSVISDIGLIDCPFVCNHDYDLNTVVKLSATADSGIVFTGWTGAGCSGTGTCVVTMDQNHDVTATFQGQQPISLVFAGTGSGVITDNNGLNCSANCVAFFDFGTTITLNATADEGFFFGGWSGAGCSGTDSCVVTMDQVQTVTVAFDSEPPPTGSVTLNFQQGVNGYTGTQDTFLRDESPNADNGNRPLSKWMDGGQKIYGLLKFENIFGSGAEQIPVGATIQSATLTVEVYSGGGDAADLHEAGVVWDESESFNSFGGEPDVQADELGTLLYAGAGLLVSEGAYSLDVTGSLSRWSAGPTSNQGWVLMPTDKDQVEFRSSEYGTATLRPQLSVTYALGGTGSSNQAPTAIVDSYNGTRDTPMSISAPGVLDNDSDPNSDPLTTVLDSNASNGTVVLNTDGSFTYTPNGGFSGSDSFTYHAHDGELDSNTVTVTLTINGAPVANDDSVATLENVGLSIAVLANDTDDGGLNAASVGVQGGPSNGTTSVDSGTGAITYTPNPAFVGTDSFTYTVSDLLGLESNVATVTVDVTDGNVAPTALADGYSGTQDIVLTVSAPGVLTNDSDPNSDPMTAVLDTNASNGTVVLNADGSFTFTPNGGFNGTDSFTYHAFDGELPSASVEVTLTMNPDGGTPVTVTFQEGVNGYVGTQDTFIRDASPNADNGNRPLSRWHDGSSKLYGLLKFENIFGSAAEQIPMGATIQSATLTVEMFNKGGDAADLYDSDVVWVESESYNSFGGEPDVQPDELGALVQPANGAFVNSGSYSLDVTESLTRWSANPASNQGWVFVPTGSDLGEFRSSEYGTSTLRPQLTVTYVLGGSGNQAPSATLDSYNGSQDTLLTVSAPGVLTNDSDPNSDPITAVLDTNTSNGTVALNTDGSFTYTPNSDFNGTESFTYHAHDGALNSTSVTVTLNINGAPVANDDSTTTGLEVPVVIAVLTNDTDDGGLNVASVGVQSGPSNGTTSVDNGTGAITYTPNSTFIGLDSFTYTVFDLQGLESNTASVTVDVTDGNVAPTAVADGYNGSQDTVLTVSVPGVLDNDSDPNSDPLTAVLDTNVSNGTVTLNANGSLTYNPNSGFSGTDSFTYHAHDGDLDSNTVMVTLMLNGVPVATDDSATTVEDVGVSIAVLSNDTDDGGLNAASVGVQSGPSNGTTSVVSGTGAITYTPNSGHLGEDSFTYTVLDTQGLESNVATVTVTVNPAGGSPVIVTFQEGLNNYAGTRDTIIRGNVPNGTRGNGPLLAWDSDPVVHTLIRFEDIIGSGVDQIPSGATIQSAVLTFEVYDDGTTPDVNEALVDWRENETFNSFGGEPDVQPEEIGPLVSAGGAAQATGVLSIDVTSSLAEWVTNPSENRGWVLRGLDSNILRLRSSEYSGVGLRPKLEVTYVQ